MFKMLDLRSHYSNNANVHIQQTKVTQLRRVTFISCTLVAVLEEPFTCRLLPLLPPDSTYVVKSQRFWQFWG